MSLKLSALGLLFLVACGPAAGGATQTAAERRDAFLAGLETPRTIEQRIERLETRIVWTPADAIAVAKQVLGEKLSSCLAGHTHSFDSAGSLQTEGCSPSMTDPVIKAFRNSSWNDFPGFLMPAAGRRMINEGTWSAFHETSAKWRVTATNGSQLLTFLVYERTGLVEADTRTADQLREALLGS